MICEKCEALNALIDGYRRERDEARDALFRADQDALRVEEERDRLREQLAAKHSACPDCADYAARSARFAEQADQMQRERDEARAGAERWKASLKAFREDYWAEGNRWLEKAHARAEEAETELNRLRSFAKPWEGDAYRRGAEAMREACQQWCRAWENNGDAIADALADLRVEDKP